MSKLPPIRKVLASVVGAVATLGVVSALLVPPVQAAPESATTRATIDPAVRARMATATADTRIGAIVVLREQAGPADVHGSSRPKRLSEGARPPGSIARFERPSSRPPVDKPLKPWSSKPTACGRCRATARRR